MPDEPKCLSGHDHGGALIVALLAARPRNAALSKHARAALCFVYAPGDYFDSFSAESSAAFAASIASEIKTPGNASSIDFCASPVG